MIEGFRAIRVQPRQGLPFVVFVPDAIAEEAERRLLIRYGRRPSSIEVGRLCFGRVPGWTGQCERPPGSTERPLAG